MRSVYFLVSRVYLAEEVQELCINLEDKSDNKVFEGTS